MADVKLQTAESIKRLLSTVCCSNFNYVFKEHKGVPTLQIIFDAPCTVTGEMETQYCRVWTLQYTMCDSEVIRTAHLATRQLFEHECDEQFRYNNVAIYSPHNNVELLVKFREQENASDKRISQ